MKLTTNQKALIEKSNFFKRTANEASFGHPLRERLLNRANEIDRLIAKELNHVSN